MVKNDGKRANKVYQSEIIADDLDIKPEHAKLIDEYLSNGHNKTQAVLKLHPGLAYGSGTRVFGAIVERPEVQAYLKAKQDRAREQADIKQIDILKTLKTWLHADATAYVGLTPEELKELPPEVRGCIQDIDYTEKVYMRHGKEIKETKCKVKLVSKTDTIEKINRHIGLYAADNKQKGGNINVLLQQFTKDNPESALQLLQAFESMNKKGD